jgi:hypothetical protein
MPPEGGGHILLYDGVYQFADILDLDANNVAFAEEFIAAGAHAGRRSGEDDVAGPERKVSGKVRDLFVDLKNHFAGIRVLFHDAVYIKNDSEIVRVGDISGEDDPGAERT